MEDDHVDRPGVEAQQCVELTGTNRSIDLIALISQCPFAKSEWMKDQLASRTALQPALAKFVSLASRLALFPVLCRPGGSCEEPEPDPIPNSAVKLLSANGTKSQDLGE